MLVKLFYAILLSGAGVLILMNRRTVKSWTGNFAFAEKYIGRGGSYLVILFIGVLLIFLGLKYLFS